MFFPELGERQRQNIARQIAELIDTFTTKGRLGGIRIPRGIGLFESCREIILDLPGQWADILREEDSDSVERWRRPHVTWYHQLRTAHRPFGFARSIEVDGPEGRGHRVIEVVPSKVAREFHRTIHFIDKKEPESEPPENEPIAVLLYVPRYEFYGLATEAVDPAAEGKAKISLVYPFFRQQLGAVKRKLERKSFIPFLERLPTAFGVVGAVESKLEPEPTPEKPASFAEGS